MPSLTLETERLIIKAVSKADAETIVPVYLNSADYLDTQTPDEPSIEMVRSDLALAAANNSVTAGSAVMIAEVRESRHEGEDGDLDEGDGGDMEIHPRVGRVFLFGQDITAMEEKELYGLRPCGGHGPGAGEKGGRHRRRPAKTGIRPGVRFERPQQ